MSRFPSNVRFEYQEAHSSNFTRGSWRKDHIVLHWWNDPSRRPTFGGVVSWFRNPTANVSIQYMVEANRITQMMPESAMAWHSGNNNSNRHGIGIEVNPRLNAGDYETTAVLVAEIERRLGRRMPLRRHRDVNSSTACPGHMDVARIRRRADQIKGGTSTPTPASPAPVLEGEVMSWSFRGLDYVNKKASTKNAQLARAHQYAYNTWQRIRQAAWRTWMSTGIWNHRTAPDSSLTNAWSTIRKDGYRGRTWVQYAYFQARKAREEARAAKDAARENGAEMQAGFTALADQLDSLKPGLAQAVKDAMAQARDEQVKITAAEVAQELDVEASVSVKDGDDEPEDDFQEDDS